MKEELPFHPLRRADMIFRKIEGEFVVYGPAIDRSALLNPTAAMVLELCDGSHAPEQIASQMAETFSLSPEQLQADVDAALSQFSENGFLDSEHATSGPHHTS